MCWCNAGWALLPPPLEIAGLSKTARVRRDRKEEDTGSPERIDPE